MYYQRSNRNEAADASLLEDYYAMQFTWTRFCELLWQIRSTLDLYVQMHTTFLEKWKTKPFFFTRLNKLIRETSKFEILSIIPNCPINGPFRGMSQWMNSDVVDRANIRDLVIAGGREIGRKFNENNEGERRNELRYSEVAKITNTDRWTGWVRVRCWGTNSFILSRHWDAISLSVRGNLQVSLCW